jgi:hypothetical protein
MKLRAGDKGKTGVDREAVQRRQPCRVVLERDAFARALGVEAERAQIARVLPQRHADRASHSPVSAFLGRTRFGSRSASSSRPTSSRRGSTRCEKGAPLVSTV